MYRIIPALLCIGCVGVTLFLWRGVSSTERPVSNTGNTITVTDLAGRQVTLRKPIERIVLLRSFFIYDLLPILGDDVENKLVGWDSSSPKGDRDAYLTLLERFPRLSEVTVLGDSLRDAVSPEAVLALKPDLVIIHTFMQRRQLKTVEQLERAGLPLLFLSSEDPYRDPQRSLLLLGEVLGKEEEAREATQFIDGELDEVFGRLAEMQGPEPSIYLEAAGCPKEYGSTYGFDTKRRGGSWGDIMAGVRCRNIVANALGTMGRINPEYLLKADPDVIVLAGANWTDIPGSLHLGYYADAAEARHCLRAFTVRPGWEELEAVKNNRLYGIHMRFCGHVTAFVAAQQLAKWLYPEEVKDINPEQSLREFHERFMPIDFGGTWMIGLEENE